MASAVIPFPVARRDVPHTPSYRVAQAKAEGEVATLVEGAWTRPSEASFVFSILDAILYTAPQRQKVRVAGVLFNEMARCPGNAALVEAYSLAWRHKKGIA